MMLILITFFREIIGITVKEIDIFNSNLIGFKKINIFK